MKKIKHLGVLGLLLCACNSMTEKTESFESARLSDNGRHIILECDTFHKHSYYISLGSLVLDSGKVDSIKSIPISGLIKNSDVDLKEIARIGAKMISLLILICIWMSWTQFSILNKR